MSRPRRIPAILAAVSVAWAALWPLVSAAHAAMSGETVMICHQAGSQVPMGELPDRPDTPADGGAKVHCPLCLVAFYAGFSPPIVAASHLFSTSNLALEVYCAPLPSGIGVRLPRSRAPPAFPSI